MPFEIFTYKEAEPETMHWLNLYFAQGKFKSTFFTCVKPNSGKNFKWHLNNKSPQPGNNSPEIFSFCSCPNMSSGIKMPSYEKIDNLRNLVTLGCFIVNSLKMKERKIKELEVTEH